MFFSVYTTTGASHVPTYSTHNLFDTLSENVGTRLVFSTLSGNGALADEYACVLRIVFGKERGWNVAQKSEYNAYSKDDRKTRN